MIEARRSAVIVPVDLPPALERIRVASDPVALLGIPAHITLLFPFLEPARLGREDLAALREIVAGEPAFDLELAAVRTFPGGGTSAGVAYLAPRPDEPFRRLTRAIWATFPDHPPYGGEFDEVVPHLTLADNPPNLDEVIAGAAPLLPIRRRVDEVCLIVEGDDDRWARRAVWPLRSSRPA